LYERRSLLLTYKNAIALEHSCDNEERTFPVFLKCKERFCFSRIKGGSCTKKICAEEKPAFVMNKNDRFCSFTSDRRKSSFFRGEKRAFERVWTGDFSSLCGERLVRALWCPVTETETRELFYPIF
jgi:hypothetical protein